MHLMICTHIISIRASTQDNTAWRIFSLFCKHDWILNRPRGNPPEKCVRHSLQPLDIIWKFGLLSETLHLPDIPSWLWAWFWTWLSVLGMPLHMNMLCKTLRDYELLDQKWLAIHFFFLFKNDMNCFENSSCKLLLFNNSANSSWAWWLNYSPLATSMAASWNINCVWFADPSFP